MARKFSDLVPLDLGGDVDRADNMLAVTPPVL